MSVESRPCATGGASLLEIAEALGHRSVSFDPQKDLVIYFDLDSLGDACDLDDNDDGIEDAQDFKPSPE